MLRYITTEDLYQFKQVSRPRISPDGQRVAFVVTTIDERKQEYHSSIWIASTDGGEAKRFTGGASNAHSPNWSPDGRWLAFVTDREGEPVAKDQTEQKKQGKAKSQIWLIPTDGGEARQLTSMQHGASNPVWSPDSKQIVFNAQVGPADEENEDGTTLPKVRVIDRLWYRLDGVGFIYERRNHLFLIDVADGDPQQLTDGDWDDTDPTWSTDGRTLYALASHRGASRLFAIATSGAGTNPPTLTPGEVHVRDYSIDTLNSKMALLIGSPTRLQEIFVRSVAPESELHRLTTFNDALLSEMDLYTPEYMPYTGADGWPMDGWILKPRNFDASKKYPLIVEIHGGPATQYGYGFFHEMQLLTAEGYVVLFTNPRGSCGYGREFSLA